MPFALRAALSRGSADRLEWSTPDHPDWRALPFASRAQTMQKAAGLLRARRTDHARVMALEMGKPIAQGEAEVDKCAWVCEYYAQHAEAMLAPQPYQTDASASYVRFDPLGPVLAVMPWNFPFWQVMRFAAPALPAWRNLFVCSN